MTSIRYVRPYLPLIPGHAASASIASTTSSTRPSRHRSRPYLAPGVAHRKTHSTSWQAQSAEPCTCKCVVHCVCRPHVSRHSSARWVAQQAEHSGAQPVRRAYPTQLVAAQAAPSEWDMSVSLIKAPASDRVPFWGKIFGHPRAASEASAKKEFSPTFTERKTRTSGLEDVQAPMDEACTLPSNCLRCDVRTAKPNPLSLAWKSRSFELHQGVPALPRLELSRACSSPEMTPATSNQVTLAGDTCTRQSANSSRELAGDTHTSWTEATSNTSKQGRTRSSKRKRSQNDTLLVDQSMQGGSPQVDGDGADFETDSSSDDSFPGCTCGIEDDVYLGVDIPMTNLGLTSTDLMLLF